jgi:hypothetical protein
MRTVTFSDPRIRELVAANFECAWTNVDPELRYRPGLYRNGRRLNLSEGVGANNIAIVFATPDRKVLSVLPGYWSPETLRAEIEFVLLLRNRMLDSSYRLRKGGVEAFDRAHAERAAAVRPNQPELALIHDGLRWEFQRGDGDGTWDRFPR